MSHHSYPAGELSMAGKIRTKEKCPQCGKAYKGEPLRCPTSTCKTHPKRFYIDIYVSGQGQKKIYYDTKGDRLTSWEITFGLLVSIRYEITKKTFDHTKYVKADKLRYCFKERIESWYQDKVRQVENGHLALSYSNKLKLYKDNFYLPYFGDQDIREIKSYHIHDFFNQIPDKKSDDERETPLSLKYMKNIMGALENFFATMHKHDYIEKKPSFPVVTLDRKAPRWVDRKTQVEIIKTIPEQHRPLFAFLAFQGVRPGEAMALRVKDMDLEKGLVTITRTFSDRVLKDRVKSKVVRARALNPVLMPTLIDLCRDKHPEAYVFTNSRGRHYTESGIKKHWKKVKEAMGLDLTLYQATRHSWATNAFKDGSDLKSIGDILGHTDIRTTLKYAHSDIDNQKAVFKRQGEIVDIGLQPSYSPRAKGANKKSLKTN